MAIIPPLIGQATLASLDMDLDLILHPSSFEDLANGLDNDPFLRQLSTPSISASVRSLAATEHATALRHARQPWTKHLEEEEEDEEISRLRLTSLEKKQFVDNPHWQHLLWTLED